MINRPKFFMGYEMIYDPSTMQYIIKDDNGNSVRAGEWELENDSEYMTNIVDTVNSWTKSYIPAGATKWTEIKSKIDLRDISTRDLLNEAFKRGAIKQMHVKRMVASEMIKDLDFVEHMQKSILHDAVNGAVRDLEKYGVFNVGKTENVSSQPWEDVEYSVDYFICKHPLTIKKEEGDAY